MSSSSSDSSSARSEELYVDLEVEQLRETVVENTSDQTSEFSLESAVAAPGRLTRDRRLQRFLASPDLQESIELWLGRPLSISKDDKESLARKLNRDVAIIDEQLNRQLNVVIHHPRFQKLEASWRGLKLMQEVLAQESSEHDPTSSKVKLKILDVSWSELEEDFSNAGYVEQSATFDKIYEQEFGTHGGEPFGLLIGDYEVDNSEASSGDVDDLFVLDNLSAVAASAFSPFVTNASPKMLELDDFSQLDEISDFSPLHNIKNLRWNRLVAKEDARFLGLCLPRVLMRCPYGNRPEFGLAATHQRSFREKSRLNEFCFQEDVAGNDSSKHLWGGAAYAYGTVVLRSFCRSGWLNDIRGVDRESDGGGLISHLPVEYYSSDGRVLAKPSTDGIIPDSMEKALSDQGFIPLCAVYGAPSAAFYSGVSIQRPKEYESEVANANARLSAMLHNILCVSRFAHFLKQIGRDAIGRFDDPHEIESELSDWIGSYVTSDLTASVTDKARYPLFGADVQVKSVPGKAGNYVAIFDLQPHHEIEGLNAGIRLKTEL